MHTLSEFLVDVNHERATIRQRSGRDHFFAAATLRWDAVPNGLEKRRGLANLKGRQRGQFGDRQIRVGRYPRASRRSMPDRRQASA